MVGGVIAGALLVPLAIPGYMLGSRRWLRRAHSWWEAVFVMAAFFFAWYGVLHLIGGPEALVPIAMLYLVIAYGVGTFTHDRRVRARARRTSN